MAVKAAMRDVQAGRGCDAMNELYYRVCGWLSAVVRAI